MPGTMGKIVVYDYAFQDHAGTAKARLPSASVRRRDARIDYRGGASRKGNVPWVANDVNAHAAIGQAVDRGGFPGITVVKATIVEQIARPSAATYRTFAYPSYRTIRLHSGWL